MVLTKKRKVHYSDINS